jgi:hypothetical protein
MSRTERFKKSIFPSAMLMWNNLELRDRDLSSVKVYKRSLCQYFDIQTYNKLYDFANDRFSSILHTRLRCCGLNYYLFKINCILSPMCICNTEHETVAHYLLRCPVMSRYLLSDLQRVNILLSGSTRLNISENQNIFKSVQYYIKQTERFS